MSASVVYAVSEGEYSDYSVRVLFTDKAVAEAHAEALGRDARVEEFELLTEPPTRMLIYSVSNATYRGNEPHEWQYEAWSYDRGSFKRVDVTEWKGVGAQLRVTGWDKKAVHKAFYDRWAQIKAAEAGVG